MHTTTGFSDTFSTTANSQPQRRETKTRPVATGVFRRLIVAALLCCFAAGFSATAAAADNTPAAGTRSVGVLPPTPTVAEARQIVLAYMSNMATQEWVCQSVMDFSKAKTYTKNLIYQPGVTYVGLPYVSNHDGLELFRAHLDGGKTYTGPTTYKHCLGVSCAPAIKVAYRNVSPTVAFGGTPNILPHARKGTVAVGDYQWEMDTPADATLTKDIVQKSTSNTMLEAYALLQPADTVATRVGSGTTINGHARLVASQPVVLRGADGKIVAATSYVHVIEQCGSFNKEAKCNTTWRVNKKYTFAELVDKYYVPLTLEEFKTGRFAPAEISVVGLPAAEKIAASNKLPGVVTSNFMINEVDATVSDAAGRVAARMRHCPQSTRCELAKIPFDHDITKLPAGTYRFVLTVKIGYGDYTHADYTFRK